MGQHWQELVFWKLTRAMAWGREDEAYFLARTLVSACR